MTNKGLWAGLVAAIALSIIALVLTATRPSLVINGATGEKQYGGMTNLDELTLETGLKIGSAGTEMVEQIKTTATINPDSVAGGHSTSSIVTLTGASANGALKLTRTGDWSGYTSSSMNIFGIPGTNNVTIYFQNASSTAKDLSGSTYILEYTEY